MKAASIGETVLTLWNAVFNTTFLHETTQTKGLLIILSNQVMISEKRLLFKNIFCWPFKHHKPSAI